MNIALTTSHDRMAPCFAGVDLSIVDEQTPLGGARRLSTHGWHPLAWGRELMKNDVAVLLCAGIDLATWGGLCGHGIQVVPTAMGSPENVLAAWREKQLRPTPVWPAYAAPPRGGRRRRFRGGRT